MTHLECVFRGFIGDGGNRRSVLKIEYNFILTKIPFKRDLKKVELGIICPTCRKNVTANTTDIPLWPIFILELLTVVFSFDFLTKGIKLHSSFFHSLGHLGSYIRQLLPDR